MTSLRHLIVSAVLWSVSGAALAQLPSWNAEQSAVWEVVESSWVDDVGETGRWPESYVHEKVVVWGDDLPSPLSKEQFTRWLRFRDAGGSTLHYILTPTAIVVEDDTAVVHYHAFIVTEDEKAERERVAVDVVEVLIRQRGAWKYLSTVSFTPNLNEG